MYLQVVQYKEKEGGVVQKNFIFTFSVQSSCQQITFNEHLVRYIKHIGKQGYVGRVNTLKTKNHIIIQYMLLLLLCPQFINSGNGQVMLVKCRHKRHIITDHYLCKSADKLGKVKNDSHTIRCIRRVWLQVAGLAQTDTLHV